MDHRMTAVERAFQLAKSGQVAEFSEIVKALRGEGYSVDQTPRPDAEATAGGSNQNCPRERTPYELAFANRRMTSL